ncbi:hypothetical protein E2C01_033392 [Portunus trituberculatus]|uniref:Uncharacterized protein n=1 Tax=Portunus trituberculatus TaxID=210409 RepID=A0A5B7F429_PORTR|nr:hypothetical protein [Portunus trituberculatus]
MLIRNSGYNTCCTVAYHWVISNDETMRGNARSCLLQYPPQTVVNFHIPHHRTGHTWMSTINQPSDIHIDGGNLSDSYS